jgi:hypothetical protein
MGSDGDPVLFAKARCSMSEMTPTVGSSCVIRPGVDELAPTMFRARNDSVEEIGLTSKPSRPEPINEPEGRRARTHGWRNGKRRRILFGSLIALLMIHGLFAVAPGFLEALVDSAPPLDRCVTEQSVLSFLDGMPVFSAGLTNTGASSVETITLQKESISSLKIQSGDDGTVLLRFNIKYNGRQLPVEASFMLTHSDSPELHYHGWGLFMGQVVSTR